MHYIQNIFRIILISMIFMSCTESVIPYLQVEDIKFEEELIVLTFSEIPN